MLVHSNNKRDALITIMNGWYAKICEIEAEHNIIVGGNDLRPRIEYFHDAVRLLTSNPNAVYESSGRLTVEYLAYDLSCLRYIQTRPRSRLKQAQEMDASADAALLSAPGANSQVATLSDSIPLPVISQGLRAEISERYKNYTILYAALFAEQTDINFKARITEFDMEVGELAQIENLMKLLDAGKVSEKQVEDALENVRNSKLKKELKEMLAERKEKRKWKFYDGIFRIQQQMMRIDEEIGVMEKSHVSFLAGQMTLYHDAKGLVKQMSEQGLNLAGQYLDAAMQNTQGRGPGRGF